MTTPRELSRVEAAHRAAQARLGLAAAYLVLRDWGTEGPPSAQIQSTWIKPSLRIIGAVRRLSIKLARRYYRLARAIETGATLPDPDAPSDNKTTIIGQLRDDFLETLDEIESLGTAGPTPRGPSDPETTFLKRELIRQSGNRPFLPDSVDLSRYVKEWEAEFDRDAGEFIDIDEFDWLDEDNWEELEAILQKALEDDVVGPVNNRLKVIRESDAAPDAAIDQLVEQHDAAGNIAAGKVDRFGIAAGRSEISRVILRDNRVKLVARGLGPNPCNFCAMLASRGFVYKDKKTANLAGGSDSIKRYHDNCHCYPIVRWVDASEVPAANQWLQDKWYKVTKGTHGHDMRLAWRRWYDTIGREELRQLYAEVESQAA